MSILKLTLVQTPLRWENPEANRHFFTEQLEHLSDTDLIILPEMFTTGFSMAPRAKAEEAAGKTQDWMQELAARHDCAVTGSVMTRQNGQFFNRLLWVEPSGRVLSYDKKHLFTMAEETRHYTGGKERLIVNWKDWKICPMICYDLRFPVWSRNTALAYDLLLYVANWPAVRTRAWESLLPARAIENSAYVAGVNRVGKDGNQIDYVGQSAVFDPRGEALVKLGNHQQVTTIKLDKADLEAYRKKFPVHLDADPFELKG